MRTEPTALNVVISGVPIRCHGLVLKATENQPLTEAAELEIQNYVGKAGPPMGWGESLSMPFPPVWGYAHPWTFLGLLEAFDSCLCQHMTPSLCFCDQHSLSSYEDTGHWVRAHPNWYDVIWNLTASANSLFPNEVTFTVPVDVNLEEMLVQSWEKCQDLISQHAAENSPGHLRRSCSTVAGYLCLLH